MNLFGPFLTIFYAYFIAAKDGQEEVAAILLDHGASLTAATKASSKCIKG